MSTAPSTFKLTFLSLALKLFHKFALLLPFPVARALGRFAGRVALPIVPNERRILDAQVEFVRSREIAKHGVTSIPPAKILGPLVFAHVGESVMEFFKNQQILELIPEPFTPPGISPFGAPYDLQTTKAISSSGWATVAKHVREKRPMVALSAHIGCFELLAAHYVAAGVPLSVIGRDSNFESLSYIVTKLRRGYGIEMLYRDDPKTTRQMVAAMKKGRCIAALIDQDTALDGLAAPFFDLKAMYPKGPIKLAMAYDAALLFSFIVRTGPGTHHVHTDEILYDREDPDEPTRILNLFSAKLEELIRSYPDQWLWWHRRWRRRPGINYEYPGPPPPRTPAYIAWLEELTCKTKEHGAISLSDA